MEGLFGNNNGRGPFACRLRLTGLPGNTTYRYYNQVVTSADQPNDDGAGNPIFPLATGFVRTLKVDFDSTGHYGTFTTDATGTHEGWFVTEPTGGGRFVPGRFVFMRINLNDGGTGTTVGTRVTTTDSVRIVKLSAGATDSTGTGLRGTCFAGPMDFVFTYDDTTGIGRPISGSFIESDGTANTALNSYSAFYANNVDGLPGAFGVVLPNLLPTGVRRVELRSLLSGTVLAFATDSDGLWPSGANTVNPAGGTTEIVLSATDLSQTTDVEPGSTVARRFMLSQNGPNPFHPMTTIRFSVAEKAVATLVVYDIVGRVVATPFNGPVTPGRLYTVGIDGTTMRSGVYLYRLKSGNQTATRKMVLMN